MINEDVFNKQDGKWFCNARDMIKYAQLKY